MLLEDHVWVWPRACPLSNKGGSIDSIVTGDVGRLTWSFRSRRLDRQHSHEPWSWSSLGLSSTWAKLASWLRRCSARETQTCWNLSVRTYVALSSLSKEDVALSLSSSHGRSYAYDSKSNFVCTRRNCIFKTVKSRQHTFARKRNVPSIFRPCQRDMCSPQNLQEKHRGQQAEPSRRRRCLAEIGIAPVKGLNEHQRHGLRWHLTMAPHWYGIPPQ
jgi:hypothetical protein